MLPEETEACASVTSAFLQVRGVARTLVSVTELMRHVAPDGGVRPGDSSCSACNNPAQVLNTLFFVETRRIENPRNILQLLSMNTRRTKVVELSSGTHRCGQRQGVWRAAFWPELSALHA